MVYSEKQVLEAWMPQVRWPNGDSVNLVNVRAAIERQAEANGIPVAFSEEQMKVGGLFNQKLQAKENYYTILRDCLENVTGA